MRTTRTSNYQYHLLVEYMEKYGDIAKIPFTPAGRERTLHHWNELTEILNSNGSIGPVRTSFQWRKVWADFKNSIKRKMARGGTTPSGTRDYKTSLEGRVLALCNSPRKAREDCSVDTHKMNENGAKVVDTDNLDDAKLSDTLYLSDSVDEDENSSDDEPLALKKDYSIQNYSGSPDNLTIVSNPEEITPPIIEPTEIAKQGNADDVLVRHVIQKKIPPTPKQNETITPKNVTKLPITKDNRAKTPTPWPVKDTNVAPNPEKEAPFNVKEDLAKHIQDIKDARYDKLIEAIGKDPKQIAIFREKLNQREDNKVSKPKRRKRSVVQCINIDEYKRDNANQPIISVPNNNLKPVPLAKLKSLIVNNMPSTVTSKSATPIRSASVTESNNETRNVQNVVENTTVTKELPQTNNNTEKRVPENKNKENAPAPNVINVIAHPIANPTPTVNNVPAPINTINNNYVTNAPNPPVTRKRKNVYNHEMYHYQREVELIKLEIEREKIKMKNRCLSLIENLLQNGENK